MTTPRPETKKTTPVMAIATIDTDGITHADDDEIDWHYDSDGNLDGVYIVLEI